MDGLYANVEKSVDRENVYLFLHELFGVCSVFRAHVWVKG
jgi:hypothetical protein